MWNFTNLSRYFTHVDVVLEKSIQEKSKHRRERERERGENISVNSGHCVRVHNRHALHSDQCINIGLSHCGVSRGHGTLVELHALKLVNCRTFSGSMSLDELYFWVDCRTKGLQDSSVQIVKMLFLNSFCTVCFLG